MNVARHSFSGAELHAILQHDRLLRLPQVLEQVPVGKTTLYRWIREGFFPPSHQIGPNCTAWLQSEVTAFVQKNTATTR